MGEKEFYLKIIALLNEQASKKKIKDGLKTMDNSMYVKVISKLSIALSQRQLKKDLKQLNDLYLQVGADLKIDSALKKKLQGRIKTLQDSISDLQIGVSAKDSNIAKTVTEARNKGQRVASRTSIDFNIEVKKEKAIADLEYMAKKYSKLFSNASASAKYNNILNTAYGITDAKQLSNVRASIAAFTSELKANNLTSQSLGDKWKSLIDRAKDLFSAASAVTLIFSQVKQAVSSFLQLDTAMTNLYKVQDQITSRDQFSGLLTKWNKLAQNLAVTTESLISSMEAWSKIGFDLDMSEQLAEITSIFEKTAEISNEKATSTLISAAQAFTEIDDLGVDDYVKRVEAVGNKINAIGNKYSIDSEGIADGLQNASAALKVAGNDLNETISLITATNKIYQNPEEGSNMLKVASMRLRGQVDALKEMGEDAEGVSTDLTKIQQQVYKLTGNKVNIFEDDENLKSTYQMILEIGEVFDSLSDRSQADLLEVMFGKQRASAGAALLLNYEELEKIKNDSINAANSMAEEYSKYMESAEAHITIFKEKLIETYSTFMSGDLIKYTADLGSGLLDLVNSTDLLRHGILAVLSLNIGKGITTIGASIASTVKQMNMLGSALQQVKNLPVDSTRVDVLEQVGNATKSLTEKNLKLLLSQKQLEETDRIQILSAHKLNEEEAKAKLEKMGLVTVTQQQTTANVAEAVTTGTLRNAMISLKASIIGVGTSIKAAFLSNPIGITLMGITTAISIGTTIINSHNKKLEEAKQAMQDAKQEYQDLTSEVANLNEELETTQERLKELDTIGYNNLSLTEQEEYDRLKATNDELEREYRIKEALAKVKAQEVAENARKSLGSKSEGSIENYTYGVERERVDQIDSINEYLNLAEKQRQSLEEMKQALEDYENTYSGTSEEMVKDKSWQKLNDNVADAEKALSDTEKVIGEKYENIEEDAEGLVDSFGNVVSGCEEMYQRVEDLKNRTDEYFNLATEVQDEIKDMDSVLEEPQINTRTLFAQLTEGKEALDTFQTSVKSATDAYSTLLSGNYSASELLDSIQTINEAMSDMGGSLNWEFINSQTDSLELLGDAIQHISQKYAESILSDAGIDTDSELGQMLANIIQQIYDAEAAFEGMNSQLDNLQSSYQTLTSILESYNETGYISLDNLQSLLTADENLIQMLEVENGQLALNQAAYENLVAVQLLEFKAKLNDAAAAEIETLAKQKAEQATNQNADASQNAVEKLDAETAAFNRNTSAAIANAVAKAEESGVSEAEIQGIFDKYTEVWNSAMSNYNVDFDGFMSGGKSAASKSGKEAGDAYIKAFEEEYSNLKDMLNRGEISEAQYLNKLRSLYTKYFKDRKKYLDEYKKYESEYLSGMLDLHNKALSSISTLLNRRISAANDAKSAAIDAISEEKEARLDAINEEKEARLDLVETKKKELEAEEKLIDKQIAAKNKIIDGIREEIDAAKEANEQKKQAINLQQDEYNLQRLLNQRSKQVYKDGQFVFETDTSGVREAKQKVEDDKLEIEISQKEKGISLIEKEIDLLNDKKDSISEQISLLDEEIDRINEYYDEIIKDTEKYYDNLIKQQEKYWDSIIQGMEQTKSRYEELAEVEEIAKAFSYIQQVFGDLGYTVEDVLNGSDAAFEDFKSRYISVINDMNSNSDFTDGLVHATGIAKENLGSFLDKTKETAEGLDELGEKGSEMDSVAEGMDRLSESATSASTSTEGLSDNLSTINDTLTAIPEADKFDSLTTSFTNLGDAIKGVADALGVGEEGTVGGLVGALQEISTLSIDGVDGSGGIISQFESLKSAVEGVTSAISGGGGSSGGDASGSSSASMSAGAGGEGTSGLVGAIEEFKSATDEALGGGSEEGEGSEGGGTGAIPQFEELKTAVDDVTVAIGGGESEGGSTSEGESDNLVGSIVNLGETSEETLGEADGDGVIGKFNEFKGVIEEAANQVKSISEGLDEIDGKEVECTITVNVKMNGSIPAFASGTVLGNMQIESATYNAQYGKAFASGTIGLKHDEKNALRSEYGQPELTVYPNGTTELTTSPVMSDLPKGTVIYNEEETKKIMDNKANGVGNAHANGTGNLEVAGKHVPVPPLTFLNEWDRMEKLAEALGRNVEDLLNPLNSIALDIRKETGVGRLWESINNTSNVTNNNKNIQQPVINGGINITCPGVTSKEVAQQVGVELNNLFNGMHLEAEQRSRIR